MLALSYLDIPRREIYPHVWETCVARTPECIRICLGKLTFPFDFLNNSMDFQHCQLENWNIRDLRVDFVGLNKNIAEFLLISTKSRIPEAEILSISGENQGSQKRFRHFLRHLW